MSRIDQFDVRPQDRKRVRQPLCGTQKSDVDEMSSQIMGYYSSHKEKFLKDFDSTSALIKASHVARYGKGYRSSLEPLVS
jgi:hypothetical protein